MGLLTTVSFAKSNPNLWENLAKLKEGQEIRVDKMNHAVVSGKMKKFSPEEISIEIKTQLVVIKRAEIQKVDKKKSKVKNILIAAGIGAGVGAVMLSGESGDNTYYGLVALPILSRGGAGVGAILPSHSLVYMRP